MLLKLSVNVDAVKKIIITMFIHRHVVMDYSFITVDSFISKSHKHKMLEYMFLLSLSMLLKTFVFVITYYHK